MPSVEFSDVLLMLNAGGWVFNGGHEGRNVATMTPVTSAIVHDGRFLVYAGSLAIGVDVGHLQSHQVIGQKEPREIRIVGTAMVRQQRKKADGGGFHEVEQKDTLLFRFIHAEAETRFQADRQRKQTADREQKLAKQRQEDAKRRRAEFEADRRQRTIELQLGDDKHVKCFVLTCDWKERFDANDINEASRLVFNGDDCPSLTDVPDTHGDQNGLVVSTVKISAKQAQAVWEIYIKNLRR